MASRTLPATLALFVSLLLWSSAQASDTVTGTLEKLIATKGSVTLRLDAARLSPAMHDDRNVALDFEIGADSWFTILVFNGEMRTAEGGALPLVALKAKGDARFQRLLLEKLPDGGPYELAVRNAADGQALFNVDRFEYHYDAASLTLRLAGARLLLSPEFAKQLGRGNDAGTAVGELSMSVAMFPIEVDAVRNGEVESSRMPSREQATDALVPGPDVIVGDLPSMVQAGSAGTQVGLAIATTSCNNGNVELDWFQLPNTDHPVIPQNFYRMSGGATNTERIEQIGQSWVKHAFTALQQNVCNFGCTASANGTHLGVGCSDPYSTSLNGTQSNLGSRAWLNPFTGAFPGGTNPNGTFPARDHTSHTHSGTSHRLLVQASDLNTSLNPGATYFAEAQYISQHEYAWCQANPTQCNMDNNASYRSFTVSGTSSFTFTSSVATVRTLPAIFAWTGATVTQFRPAPGADGIGYVGYKVSGPTGGLYHYEYAVYNQNLDRAIQAFSVPLGCGASISNTGFHAPLNHPGFAQDGTANNAGYSNTAWTANQTATALNWSSETFADNANANAIRWGTLYNFRFDSDQPPQAVNATVGFFKTGAPVTVAVQAPAGTCQALQVVSAVSRKTHADAGVFDLPLSLTGTPTVESRFGSGDGEHTLVVTFNNNVVSGNAAVTTTQTGSLKDAPTFSGKTMTLNLTGVPDAHQLTISLSNVTDSYTQTLANAALSVSFLAGDVNGDGMVNSADALIARNVSGQATDGVNFHADLNADGGVNSADITAVRARSGGSLTAAH